MIVPYDIEQYTLEHTSALSPVLTHIERETYLKVLSPHMLSGVVQGCFLMQLCKMLQAKNVIEIGTYTAYATVCMALGMPTDGVLHTIEANEELLPMINNHLQMAEVQHQVQVHIGEGKKVLPTIEGPFDIAFIDADKKSNLWYYEALLPKMRKGGVILVDNVLWKGKVVSNGTVDTKTKDILNLNKAIANDNRVIATILPMRDGLLMATVK